MRMYHVPKSCFIETMQTGLFSGFLKFITLVGITSMAPNNHNFSRDQIRNDESQMIDSLNA